MGKARINLFQDYRTYSTDIDEFDEAYPNFTIWDSKNFNNQNSVKNIWAQSLTFKDNDGVPFWNDTLEEFYKTFVCDDKSWAKKTTYCGGSGGGGNTNTATWDNFPCVVELAKSKGITKESNNSYVIGDFRYFPNGRKGIISTGKKDDFTCNDPEFKKSGRGGNTSQGWAPDPTGNQTWEYQVRDCKWIARKKGQTREYNISDNPKYKSSVDTLNQKLPNLIKDCNKTKPEETKSTSTGVEVPTATVPSQGSSTVTTVTQPGQTQGLGVPNVSELGLDEVDKLVNPVKPEIVTTPTTQKESVEINTDILKEEFYSTLKKIL